LFKFWTLCVFEPRTFGELMAWDNVRCSSWANGKAHSGLPIMIYMAIFGHVRRLPETTPVDTALRLAVDARRSSHNLPGDLLTYLLLLRPTYTPDDGTLIH